MFMPRALAKAIDQVARQTVGKDWNIYANLLEHWQEIVGPDYARVTTPVKITFPHQPNEARRGDGTLCIRLPKGLAMEFSFKTDLIRQRINTYFGYSAVGRIVFEPVYGTTPETRSAQAEADPASLAQLRSTTETLENENLRTALESFGEALLKSKSPKA
ncbi:MAG: DciA family protein [Alphaproteobacteria bacterium]|nr:DciA family protein [Alphaproteobacteria bacterium]